MYSKNLGLIAVLIFILSIGLYAMPKMIVLGNRNNHHFLLKETEGLDEKPDKML